MNFSQRIGIKPKELPLQIEGMTDELRNSLWNCIASERGQIHNEKWRELWRDSRRWHFRLPADEEPYHTHDCHEWIKKTYFHLDWNEVYDFMEFYVSSLLLGTRDEWDKKRYYEQIEKIINFLLSREYSGYRLLNGEFTPITDQTELDAVKQGVEIATGKYENVKIHLQESISLMSKRPEPDYRNSIKESISAVEGVCKIITSENSGGIDKALAKLAKDSSMNSQMAEGFKNLYNWTSGKDGIRHPILEQSNIGLAEAKYMLVVCSAFVHYVILKTETKG